MVVDTSALLAVLFGEEHGPWAAQQMDASPSLLMSTVNLAETLMLIRNRQPHQYEAMESAVLTTGIDFVAPDLGQARTAAQARDRFPLNLGDCFAYALAHQRGLSLITLDGDFRSVDVPVLLPPRGR